MPYASASALSQSTATLYYSFYWKLGDKSEKLGQWESKYSKINSWFLIYLLSHWSNLMKVYGYSNQRVCCWYFSRNTPLYLRQKGQKPLTNFYAVRFSRNTSLFTWPCFYGIAWRTLYSFYLPNYLLHNLLNVDLTFLASNRWAE